jgi:hypothetical protein
MEDGLSDRVFCQPGQTDEKRPGQSLIVSARGDSVNPLHRLKCKNGKCLPAVYHKK